jgi:hypothetical protein
VNIAALVSVLVAAATPPPAFVDHKNRSAELAPGSSCWTYENARKCTDYAPPQQRSDLRTLKARVGDLLIFRLAFAPSELRLVIFRNGRVTPLDLRPAQTFNWRPRRAHVGTTYLYVSASTRSSPYGLGQAGYVVRFDVRRR